MLPPKVIYEQEEFLGVSKPSGMLVHASGTKHTADKETLVDWLLPRFPELRQVGDDPATRPGIVHRLDKDTSGVILIPRTQEYFLYLKSLFAGRQMVKTYLALVWGHAPAHGSITLPIGIKSGTTKRTVRGGKMVKEARTDYELVRHLEATSLLKVMPRTGRTHQIRVHLASAGHPVAGDPLYGGKKKEPWVTRLMLHALSLEFPSASGARIRIEAEPDADFNAVVDAAAGPGVVHSSRP